ncbi:MAG: hypothetical protein AB2A00_15785 [Myxococcota bacterium]
MTPNPPPNARDNELLRTWPSSVPQYEQWYSLVNHPTQRFCFWFRYSLLTTSTGVKEARVWAIPVDGDSPEVTRVLTAPLPQDAMKQRTGGAWGLEFGTQGLVEHGRMRGSVRDERGTVEWDLSFTPATHTVEALASPLLRKLVSKSSHRSPNSSVRMNGYVSVDGRRVELGNASGHQGHTEGSRMQNEWVWGRAGEFEQDPSASFEGVASRRGGARMCAFHVEAHGRSFALNRLRHLKGPLGGLLGKGTRTEWQLGQWNMVGEEQGRRLQVTMNAIGMAPLKVRYLDTDGSYRFNCAFPMASCAMNITPAIAGDQPASTLLCKGKANMEFVASEPLQGTADEYLPKL